MAWQTMRWSAVTGTASAATEVANLAAGAEGASSTSAGASAGTARLTSAMASSILWKSRAATGTTRAIPEKASVTADLATLTAGTASVTADLATLTAGAASLTSATAGPPSGAASLTSATARPTSATATSTSGTANVTSGKANATSSAASPTSGAARATSGAKNVRRNPARPLRTKSSRANLPPMAAKKKSVPSTNKKPYVEFNAIYQLGVKAQLLVTKYQAQIGARLSPAFLAAFASALAGLLTAVPAAMNAKKGKIQLTAAQTTALDTGYNLAKGFRTTVKGHHPEKDVLLAYGVGAKMSRLLVKDVTAALQQIIDRIANQPAEAAGFGFVQEDVDALTVALAAIVKADQEQEKARASAPLTTQQRNTTANQILADVKKISGAGMRTFTDDATVYGEFEALSTGKAA
jgi:hypothetical protein